MSEKGLSDWSFEARLALPMIIGLFGGFFYFAMMSTAIDLTSSWFNGQASAKQIRRALIFGAIPRALSVIFYVLLALVFGVSFFDNAELPAGHPEADITFFHLTIGVITTLTVWSMIATFKTLAEVQGFKSAWKACLHYIVAMTLVLTIPALLWILAKKLL